MPGIEWSAEEKDALLSFIEERKGDVLSHIGQIDSALVALEKAWQALGKVKGFGTRRTAYAL